MASPGSSVSTAPNSLFERGVDSLAASVYTPFPSAFKERKEVHINLDELTTVNDRPEIVEARFETIFKHIQDDDQWLETLDNDKPLVHPYENSYVFINYLATRHLDIFKVGNPAQETEDAAHIIQAMDHLITSLDNKFALTYDVETIDGKCPTMSHICYQISEIWERIDEAAGQITTDLMQTYENWKAVEATLATLPTLSYNCHFGGVNAKGMAIQVIDKIDDYLSHVANFWTDIRRLLMSLQTQVLLYPVLNSLPIATPEYIAYCHFDKVGQVTHWFTIDENNTNSHHKIEFWQNQLACQLAGYDDAWTKINELLNSCDLFYCSPTKGLSALNRYLELHDNVNEFLHTIHNLLFAYPLVFLLADETSEAAYQITSTDSSVTHPFAHMIEEIRSFASTYKNQFDGYFHGQDGTNSTSSLLSSVPEIGFQLARLELDQHSKSVQDQFSIDYLLESLKWFLNALHEAWHPFLKNEVSPMYMQVSALLQATATTVNAGSQ